MGLQKNLLILAPVEDDDNPAQTELNWVDFYIHVHELPLGRHTKEMAEFIGNQQGKFRDVDLKTGNQSWGSVLRIRVGIDVQKLLRRVLKLCTMLSAESLISFAYERLPNFYYWCGKIGHIMKFCKCQLDPVLMRIRILCFSALGFVLLHRQDYVLEVELFMNLDLPLPRDFATRLHPLLKLNGEQMFSATPQLHIGTHLYHIYPSAHPY
ncbi:UNVERIFIED_CONTAM: hypothetical protein Slati_1428600 [Sesamum latifolium]|uniref:Zinc knuckle CX2CX4HX4C domain-containing protein n=1 Tax=Sesamum latifolium TaxID=2727402 RepID=A0AAW2X3F4_9LAMI